MRKEQKQLMQEYLEEIQKTKQKEEKLQEIIKREQRLIIKIIDNTIWIIAIICMILIIIQQQEVKIITTDVLWVETCEGIETGYIESISTNPENQNTQVIKGNYKYIIKNETK